jgi:hypothetical protein
MNQLPPWNGDDTELPDGEASVPPADKVSQAFEYTRIIERFGAASERARQYIKARANDGDFQRRARIIEQLVSNRALLASLHNKQE